jgi:hypothetical protein
MPTPKLEAAETPESKLVKYWCGQVEMSGKREKTFRKRGHELVEQYEAEKKLQNQFNILYSNTETLAPALYNSLPRPVVRRRHKNADVIAGQAAKLAENILVYLLDDGGREGTTFHDATESAVVDALVPGRGLTWFHFDAEIVKQEAAAAAASKEAQADADPSQDQTDPAPASERVKAEYVCTKQVPWESVRFGYGRTWAQVPWLGLIELMTREELIENFGKELGGKVPVIERTDAGDDDEEEGRKTSDADTTTGIKTACVYQIWDKAKRKVLFICPEYPEAPLKEIDDPLDLDGFYPCAQPLTFFRPIKGMVPRPLYAFYEDQAKELNRVTFRINKIIGALKVRGFYDQAMGEISRVLVADDNTLLPVDNSANMGPGGGSLEKSIWLMPLEKLIQVLQQLYIQREQIKSVIYEITGVSDILRGSSVASETATAQTIKAEWGGLRLKKGQKRVQSYVRDGMRIMLEIAVSKLPVEQLRSMSGLEFPLAAEKAQIKAQLQEFAMQTQGLPPSPQLQAQLQPLQAKLQQPSFEEILAPLQNDLKRKYLIDIETNSTVDAEATDDKKDIAEMMGALSQFIVGVGPLIQDGIMPFEAAQAMLLAIASRFRFGNEIEDKLKMMKPPQMPDPKQAEAAKKEVEKGQQMLVQEKEKLTAQASDLDMQAKELALERSFAMKELAMEKKYALKEIQLSRQEADQSLALREQGAQQKLDGKAQMIDGKAKEVQRTAAAVKSAPPPPKIEDIVGPIIAALQEGFAGMQAALVEEIGKSAKVQKRAVKQLDGSWATQVIQ